MTKQEWKFYSGEMRAAVCGGREKARGIRDAMRFATQEAAMEAQERGLPIYERGMAMLESIKLEIKEKLDALWSSWEDSPEVEAAARVAKVPLGKDNKDFPEGYFDKF